MTLSAGTGFNAVGREIFGFSNQIDFSTVSSGTDITAFDFTSPSQLYLVELQPGINTDGMAANDILSFNLTGNNLPIFQSKFALAAASEPVQNQLPAIKFVLPGRTRLQAVFTMQTAASMTGTATCSFRGVAFG